MRTEAFPGECGILDKLRIMLDGVLQLGRALAIENRFPEPRQCENLVAPPLAFCWKEALPVVREFAEGKAAGLDVIAETLAEL